MKSLVIFVFLFGLLLNTGCSYFVSALADEFEKTRNLNDSSDFYKSMKNAQLRRFIVDEAGDSYILRNKDRISQQFQSYPSQATPQGNGVKFTYPKGEVNPPVIIYRDDSRHFPSREQFGVD